MEERLGETDGRSADGSESRLGRGFGEMDAGETGRGAMEVRGGGEGEKSYARGPGEDGNGGAIDLK